MRHRAMTLPETLVVAVLMLLVLGAVYGIYVMSSHYFASAQTLTEAQQEAVKAVADFERLVAQAEASTVTRQSSPPALLFLSARTEAGPFAHDENGELLWQRWSCIYLDGTELVLKERTLPSPTATVPETVPTVNSLVNDNTLARQVLAHSVSDLQFPAGLSSETVTVELVTRVDGFRAPSGVGDQARTEVTLATEIPLQEGGTP